MEKIKIIYEDKQILVVDKPAGMNTTRENLKSQIPGVKYLEDWVKENRPTDLPRQGIVHRLDKGTSGLVIIAKDKESLVEIKRQFKKRLTKKFYLAVAGGSLPKNGEINMPINRSKYSFGRFKVDEEGKNAVTLFTVLKKILIEGKNYSLIEINLKTGRTHQIRVHLSYLGWPLLGDKVYGGLMAGGITRPFLHAVRMEITHPRTGEVMKFEAPLAADLKEILNKYEA